jgi:nitrate/TMAO reductase-like tetraheme cytochrome c subunit
MILIFTSIAFADYRALFEKEFVHKAWLGSRVVEEGVCIDCHTSKEMKDDYLLIPQEWKMSIHYANNVSCHDCHGGDPDDAAVSCGTPHSGFVGIPKYAYVPEMCGKCHIGILKMYNQSGHGRAVIESGEKGPNCVTCHGSHQIQKAGIEIINSVRCSKCHSYERAKTIKQALFNTEKRMGDIDESINGLKARGVLTGDEEKMLFRTHVEFRTLFHSIDVSLVQNRTEEFAGKLGVIEKMVKDIYSQLGFRKNFSAFLFLLFICLGITLYVDHKRRN